MVAVDTPKRLTGMIVLAVFVPWLSIALTYGRSRVLSVTVLLSVCIPFAIGVASALVSPPVAGEPYKLPIPAVIAANVSAITSMVYAIRKLISLHYSPETLPAYSDLPEDEPPVDLTPVDVGKV